MMGKQDAGISSFPPRERQREQTESNSNYYENENPPKKHKTPLALCCREGKRNKRLYVRVPLSLSKGIYVYINGILYVFF